MTTPVLTLPPSQERTIGSNDKNPNSHNIHTKIRATLPPRSKSSSTCNEKKKTRRRREAVAHLVGQLTIKRCGPNEIYIAPLCPPSTKWVTRSPTTRRKSGILLSPFLKSRPPSDVMEVDSDTVHKMAVRCSGVISGVGSKQHIMRKRSLSNIFHGIFPGTNWCGKGNVADSFGDLGYYRHTDRCCREHDHCPYTIPGRGFGYGHYNPSRFTMSSCTCDNIFRRCLLRVDSFGARLVKFIYFRVMQMACFYKRPTWGHFRF
ncbi:phospholipase a2 [Plakobranchus ocellatus]|uniref:Phospholipase a2 n=1 Tax=Plakobranchus ocellatus TaxID=259542 RepID=A0AAV4CBL4_9GAST|nr:phospholipase a2 [Plakobranchus ocellatus]